jgi:hypothetical protein
MWEVASGDLVRSWDGHYKAVSSLAFTDDDSFLVSGSEDAMVNVWNILDLADDAQSNAPVPMCAWTDHALPVTGIHCGIGGVNARVGGNFTPWPVPTSHHTFFHALLALLLTTGANAFVWPLYCSDVLPGPHGEAMGLCLRSCAVQPHLPLRRELCGPQPGGEKSTDRHTHTYTLFNNAFVVCSCAHDV